MKREPHEVIVIITIIIMLVIAIIIGFTETASASELPELPNPPVPPIAITDNEELWWYLGEYRRLLYSNFNLNFYMFSELRAELSELTELTTNITELIHDKTTHIEQIETRLANTNVTSIWQIGLTAFVVGLLTIILMSTIWSRAA